MPLASSGKLADTLRPFDRTMPTWAERLDNTRALAFVDSCLRGVGQICFMNNPLSGTFILVALFLYTPWLGVATIIGVVSSTLSGSVLGFDRTLIRGGLFGFNGALVGAGFATFLSPEWATLVIVYIITGAAASTIVMAALSNMMIGSWGVSPVTLPFNIVTLGFLYAALNLARGHAGPLIAPRDVAAFATTNPGLRSTLDGSSSYDPLSLLNVIFRGISQLFLADSLIVGIVIIVGMAICSRIAAVAAIFGSAIGSATGLALGADGFTVYHGLWGYNSYVSAVAIAGIFVVLSVRAVLLSIACAIATAVLYASLSVALAPWGLFALTLPFCVATIGFLLIVAMSTKFRAIPLADISTPEGSLDVSAETSI